jgi:hypothetical protein
MDSKVNKIINYVSDKYFKSICLVDIPTLYNFMCPVESKNKMEAVLDSKDIAPVEKLRILKIQINELVLEASANYYASFFVDLKKLKEILDSINFVDTQLLHLLS